MDDDALVGTWAVRSYTDPTGNPVKLFESPTGYITYFNKHVFTVITGKPRPLARQGPPFTEGEKAQLYDTVISNAGRYRFEGVQSPDGRVLGTAYHYLDTAHTPTIVDSINPQIRCITLDRVKGKLGIQIPAPGSDPSKMFEMIFEPG